MLVHFRTLVFIELLLREANLPRTIYDMEFPLVDLNKRDLARELYGYSLSTEGTQQQLRERLMNARYEEAEAQAQGFVRPGRPPIAKYGASVQPDDFTAIQAMTDEEYASFSLQVHWRLQHIHKTYLRNGLEFYNPSVLHQIDRTKSYVINLSEFWVRYRPYIHKVFVIFVSRVNGEESRLCYARSFARLPNPVTNVEEEKKTIITNDDIGRAISNILMEIEVNGRENFVAIVAENISVNLKAMRELSLVHGEEKMLHFVLDSCQLHKSFQKMFCGKSSRCLTQLRTELFEESRYMEQLDKLKQNNTQNVEADNLVKEFFAALPKVLQDMWKLEEHKDKPISLYRLNNERVNAYGTSVQNDLPPITFEECAAGGGLLQLMLFDALWCNCDGHEKELDMDLREENLSLLDLSVADDWLSILN